MLVSVLDGVTVQLAAWSVSDACRCTLGTATRLGLD